MHGYILAIIAAVPSTIAAWKGIGISRKVDTGPDHKNIGEAVADNGEKLGEAVKSLHKKVDTLGQRLSIVEEKVETIK